MRRILLIAFCFFCCVAMSQDTLRVYMASSKITCRTRSGRDWENVYKGKVLQISDSLSLPVNSEIVISNMSTSRNYRYYSDKKENINVGQLLRKIMDEDNHWVINFFKRMFSKSKVIYNKTAGITYMSPSNTVEMELSSFVRKSLQNINNSQDHKFIILKTIKKNGDFYFRIQNNSNEGFYFNILKVDNDGNIHICYNLLREKSDDILEVSLFIGAQESIDLDGISFGDYKHCDYFVVASKKEFRWTLLEKYLNIETGNHFSYNKNTFFFGKSK